MATAPKKSKMSKPVTTPDKEFTQSEKNLILEKLVTARIGLLLRHPFFGNMATRLQLVDASAWCPTLATDGRKLYYNNDLVNRMSVREVEFGIAHEILHNIFDHMGRRGGRDAKMSNIAADYAVNQILKDDKIGDIPVWLNIYQDDQYRNMAYEEIYNSLMANATIINIDELGNLLDEHLEEDGAGDGEDSDKDGDGTKPGKRSKLSAEDRQAIRDEIKEAMLTAAQSAGASNVPKGVARLIKDFTESKMDWRELLRMNIQSVLKSNFSFSRPNRKSQHCGAILPGMLFENTVNVTAAIDMSGSISDKQGNDFISEVKGIMEEYQDFTLDLFCFDTSVYNYQKFTSDNASDITEYRVKGGGGTDFTCIWSFLKDNGIEPKKLLIFTDMYPCGSFGDPDYCDTLFIAHGTTSIVAPFGETCYYEE